MTHLTISSDLHIPLEAVTQTFGVLGKRGVGKTYTANVLVEELLKAGMHVVVIDPLDAWWGLRSSADGESEGLPVVIFGGAHGDLPLEATAGTIIADVVVEQRLSVVLSLRHLSKTKQRQFVAEFCERLYHRKGEDQYREPLHVAIDEADAFIPQRVAGDTARVMGAVDDLVRRGRSSGLGVTVITQRAAVIHKDVLTQIEVLVALRTVSPQDRKALDGWIEAHDAHDQRSEFMGSLASLPIGTAWFWSPGWLGKFQKVKVRTRETFDSSATPSFGETIHAPTAVAEVDLDAVRELIAETIERAEADDPKILKRRISELEAQLTAQQPVVERIEVPALSDDLVDDLQRLGNDIACFGHKILTALEQVSHRQLPTPVRLTPQSDHGKAPKRSKSVRQPALDLGLRAGERRMLQCVDRLDPQSLTRQQLATLSGFAVKGGTFSTYFGNLKRKGLIEESADGINITVAGMDELGDEALTVPSTTDELVAMWGDSLRAGERTMLETLVFIYPQSISRESLGQQTGYTVSGGTFNTYLGKLRRNGLVEVDGADVRASDTLFLGMAVSK